MKILLSNQFFYNVGGTETMFFKLLNFLKKEGHELIVITVESKKNLNINGIKIYYVKSYVQQNRFMSPLNRIFNYNSYKITKKIIEMEKPDIAHFYNTSLISSSPILACLKNKIPTIKTFNDYEHLCPDSSKTKWSKFCDKEMGIFNCLKCDRRNVNPSLLTVLYYNTIIKNFELSIFRKTINVSICETIKKALDQSKIDSRVIYQSIYLPKNIPKLKYTANILYAGRLSKEKGVNYLIEAFSNLKNKNAKLLIVGDGPERKKLENLAKNYGLSQRIKFLGFVDKSTLQNLYEDVDFIVLPSVWQEPFGLTGLEAMSYGRPVIAFDVGGISEYVSNNENGFLVDVFNVKSLAEKMETLLSDKDLLLKFSKNSIETSKKFSDEIFYKKIKNLYRNVLND
ncbi:MAG: glycosyltransferase [Candidatus Aenigmatarchaeota archaeon]|nr:glycosyltransferase [Candidatus Aenigmarchaeota archaeon]